MDWTREIEFYPLRMNITAHNSLHDFGGGNTDMPAKEGGSIIGVNQIDGSVKYVLVKEVSADAIRV